MRRVVFTHPFAVRVTALHEVVGGLAALCLSGCADPPAGAPSAQPTAVAVEAVEALSDDAPSPSSSSTPGSELAVLSAEMPPPMPSARALSSELAPLDISMFRALSSSAPSDSVLRSNEVPAALLAEAGRSYGGSRGGVGGLNLEGGNASRRSGGLGGLGGDGASRSLVGGRTFGSTIGGKSAKDLTAADLDAALGRAGCSTSRLDSPSTPPSVALFEAKCSSRTFGVTFVPAGVTQPDAQTIAEMERVGAIWKEGGMLLAVVPKDKADRPAAVELMNKLRTADGAGSAKAVTGPKGQASLGSPGVSGGSVSNAGAVVAGMAAGFRRCYNRGLQEDPHMKGSVRVTAKIGPNGEVMAATSSGGGGLSGTVCD